MMYTSHKIGAMLLAVETSKLLIQSPYEFKPIEGLAIMAITAMVSAAIPDADEKNSTISRKIPLLLLPIRIGQLLIRFACILPGPLKKYFKKINTMVSHRGILHLPITWLLLNLLPLVAISVSSIFTTHADILLVIYIGVNVGIASHILLDTIFGGIRLLYPLIKKKIKPTPFKTQGFMEYVVRFGMLFLLVKETTAYITQYMNI